MLLPESKMDSRLRGNDENDYAFPRTHYHCQQEQSKLGIMGLLSNLRAIVATLFLCIAVFSACVFAGEQEELQSGESAPNVMQANVRFAHIGLKDGLSQSSVEALLQSQAGYIWIGTQDGLQLYDGYRFKTFLHIANDSATLSNHFITDLLESSTGDLWVGTYYGLNHYSPLEGFTDYVHDHAGYDKQLHNFIWTLEEGPKGNIWVGTKDGLERLNPATGEWTLFPIKNETSAQSAKAAADTIDQSIRIWSLAYDQENVLWIGTSAGLKYLLPGENGIRAYAPETVDSTKLLTNNHVNALVIDRQNRIWAGLEGAVMRIGANRQQATVVLPIKPTEEKVFQVRDLLLDKTGDLWIATDGDGAYWYEMESGTLRQFYPDTSDPFSLSNSVVTTLLQDRSGIIWLGTYSGGINTYNPATRLFGHYRHQTNEPRSLSSNMVWGFAHDAKERLWVATAKGLNRLTENQGFVSYFNNPQDPATVAADLIETVFADSQRRLWIGTSNGLDLWQPDTNSFRHYHFSLPDSSATEDAKVLANDVIAISESQNGSLWIGTAKGLFRFDPADGSYRWYPPDTKDRPGLPGDLVLDTVETPGGLLWIATDSGLSLLEPETGQIQNYTINSSGPLRLPDNYVSTLYRDAEGLLWIGTSNGLLVYNTQTNSSQLYTTVDGLPNNTIYCILPGLQGSLWLSTNNGLVRVKRQNGGLHIVSTYGPADGLQSREFNTSSCAVGPDGRLYFGGINGFNAFDPAKLSKVGDPASVIITDFSILGIDRSHYGADFDNDSRLTLSYNDTAFTLEFALLDFAAPEKNQFEYKLVGFDEAWLSNGTRNYVTYTNLDSGTYTFKVRGISANGVPSKNVASLLIAIEPALWATWWAYLGYVVIAVLIILGLVALQMRRIRNQHRLIHEQQQRRWAETLHQLSQALAASLDARTVASQLADHLARLVKFNIAALFVEQGADLVLVGSRGLTGQQESKLAELPEVGARLLAEFRHVRKPVRFDSSYLPARPFVEETSHIQQYLAVPLVSRNGELTLLLLGRSDTTFSDREVEIATAFTHQALNALDNASLFAEVQNLGTTDSLTRVHNRRYFFEQAELEFLRSKRYQRDLGLLLLDADHFRDINEYYGQDVGDRVMKVMAGICRDNLRHFDIIGRYSGESFIVLLPETSVNVAADLADRLRKSVNDLSIETHRGDLRLTISVGVAVNSYVSDSYTSDPASVTDDLSALINKADMALYEAKRSGRNRVVVT